MSFAQQVADALAAKYGWPLDEALNVVGDTSEHEAEGLTTDEAVVAVIGAIQASI